MNNDSIKKQLESEGFKHIYEWHDEPGVEYPSHRHKDKVTLYVIDGGLSFSVDDKVTELKEGDRFDVPPGNEHTAKVGTEGCSYIVGEVIDGDS